jgi:hypothetical protein
MVGQDALVDDRTRAAHDAAVARGDALYEDPDTGLFVMTEAYLRERGTCCDSGCRHCPYREPAPDAGTD